MGKRNLKVLGVFVTKTDYSFFADVAGKKVLEICCGSGHSLKYLSDKGATELWGLDLSQKQLDNAGKFEHIISLLRRRL